MSQLVSQSAPLQPGITNGPANGSSAVSQPHPDYSARAPDLVLMFDTHEGQRHVKSKTVAYLPATSGMRALGLGASAEGGMLYSDYLTRAYFPDLVKEAVRALTGILDREAATIELPALLEDLRELATPRGESLNDLLIQIHINQLLYGRLGILLDVDPKRDLPLLVQYPAPQILNWDDHTETKVAGQHDETKRSQAVRTLVMTVLDESRHERTSGNRFAWELVPRFRVLSLGDGETPVYTTQVERAGVLQPVVTPDIMGKKLQEIPFTFINTTDTSTKPGEVPLLNLANLALAIYRGEADHRAALFMSGQDTLVLIGADMDTSDEPTPAGGAAASGKPIIGSGAYLSIPEGADAKFIGPNSQALAEQRTSLNDDYQRAGEEGTKLLSSGSGAEAAETLRIRVAGRTATLQTIAITAASGLENALRQAAVWVGANPDEVKVTPNLDFITESQDPKDIIAFSNAKRSGTPLSWKSVHNWLREKDFTELTFEQELELMSEEADNPLLALGGGSGLGEPGNADDANLTPEQKATRDAAAEAAAKDGQDDGEA